MSELDEDLARHLAAFQKIKLKYGSNVQTIKELNTALNSSVHTNSTLKESEKKYTEEIKSLRKMCYEKEQTISKLLHYEKENKKLSEENETLVNTIKNLKANIQNIENEKSKSIQEYALHNLENIEKLKQQFEKREMELQGQLEVLQASSDLEIAEITNERINLRKKYEDQLQKAGEKENQLKQEIFKLNYQMSSSNAVLQKKNLELEQKLKTLERDKHLYTISQGNFTSATNVMKTNSAYFPTNKTKPDNQPNQNEAQQISKKIEGNTSRKFQFRKLNRNDNSKKKLLEETFDPFQAKKQMDHNNQQSTSQNLTNSEESNEINSEPTSDVQKQNTNLNSNNSSQNNSDSSKAPPKMFKLFNPKDLSYLD